MMKSALLFYRKLVSELIEMGFVINPYDPCVANKIVNGSQLTLRWHVDDLMISHKNMADINNFLVDLKNIYGSNLAESTGKTHDYLEMIFDFSFSEEVRINMTPYIQNNHGISRRN
jgi:Reverse transcriptase (RNA-dependent DNA polymerase).